MCRPPFGLKRSFERTLKSPFSMSQGGTCMSMWVCNAPFAPISRTQIWSTENHVLRTTSTSAADILQVVWRLRRAGKHQPKYVYGNIQPTADGFGELACRHEIICLPQGDVSGSSPFLLRTRNSGSGASP